MLQVRLVLRSRQLLLADVADHASHHHHFERLCTSATRSVDFEFVANLLVLGNQGRKYARGNICGVTVV